MIAMAGDGKTILISSHQIVEVERVASHVAFIHHGKLLLTGTMDELRQRVVRVQLRFDAQAPDPAALGSDPLEHGDVHIAEAVRKRPILGHSPVVCCGQRDDDLRMRDYGGKRAEIRKFSADIHFRASRPLSESALLPPRPYYQD